LADFSEVTERAGYIFLIREEIQERIPGDFDKSGINIIRLLQRVGRLGTHCGQS
jgi:hypothetical protein